MRVFGVTGYKNAGKTGLMERLVQDFTARGWRVSTLKHTHHNVDLDSKGTDSHRHRVAGAQEVMLASGNRFALMQEFVDEAPSLDELLARFSPVDLILVEGYKTAPHPKIECYRHETQHPFLHPENSSIKAIASDGPVDTKLPVLDLDDTQAIADYIISQLPSPKGTKP